MVAVLVAVPIFLVQLLASAWWLGRYRYGPAEFCLRAVTNATVPTWRRDPS
ncbi:DUF418 domain-containing protein [Plantactinospora solaniradicis]|uniref:DUF418 domain-containing protein n=1 Tax=Plantactinospora solaniradicis TaxID=1723736 RepID=A0ABW1KND2_9ACTN